MTIVIFCRASSPAASSSGGDPSARTPCARQALRLAEPCARSGQARGRNRTVFTSEQPCAAASAMLRLDPTPVLHAHHACDDRGPAADAGAGLRAGRDGAGPEGGLHLQLREVHRVAAERRAAASRSSICVLGDAAVGEALERAVKGRELAGHRMVVSRMAVAAGRQARVPRPVRVGRDGESSGGARCRTA